MAARTSSPREQGAPGEQGPAAQAAQPDLVVQRVFDAPRDLVFEAWTVPAHVIHWWGPDHFTCVRCEMDVRKGGALRLDIRAPDGTVYTMPGGYTEVDPPRWLGFVGTPHDGQGTKMFEALTEVTFADQGGKTQVTVDTWVFSDTPLAEEHLAGMREGWTENLVHLADLLPKLR